MDSGVIAMEKSTALSRINACFFCIICHIPPIGNCLTHKIDDLIRGMMTSPRDISFAILHYTPQGI